MLSQVTGRKVKTSDPTGNKHTGSRCALTNMDVFKLLLSALLLSLGLKKRHYKNQVHYILFFGDQQTIEK